MFDIHNAIELDPVSAVPVHDQVIPRDEPVPDKDVFIKVRLDQDEGPTPEGNRYAIFYNSYWVHKDWVAHKDNIQALAAKFPAFVLFDIREPYGVFPAAWYGEAPGALLQSLTKDYFALTPLIKIQKKHFKFSGVKMPLVSSKITGLDGRNSYFIPRGIVGVAAHYYGLWATNAYYNSVVGSMSNGSAVKLAITNWVRKKHKEIDDWLDCTVPELTVATVT